jgi:dienelactone hydrolase
MQQNRIAPLCDFSYNYLYATYIMILLRALLGIFGATFLAGCSCFHIPGKIHRGEGNDQVRKKDLIDTKFERIQITTDGHSWVVFQRVVKNGAPAVLILHEMPALSERTLKLAERIANHGYNVYVPLLFGKETDNANSTLRGISRTIGFVLGRREWKANSSEEREITRKLTALAKQYILKDSGTDRLAVIGLCLTGPLPLQMMGQPEKFPQLVAPVMSQPSIPIIACSLESKTSIGLTDSELANATERAEQVLYFRFTYDAISPAERLETLKVRMGAKLLPVTVDPSWYGPHTDHLAHAVLTDGFQQRGELNTPEPPGYFAFRVLIEFLDHRLRRSANYAVPSYAPYADHATH